MALTLTVLPLMLLFYATYGITRRLFLDSAYLARLQASHAHKRTEESVLRAQADYERHVQERKGRIQDYALQAVTSVTHLAKERVVYAAHSAPHSEHGALPSSTALEDRSLQETLQRMHKAKEIAVPLLFSPVIPAKDTL